MIGSFANGSKKSGWFTSLVVLSLAMGSVAITDGNPPDAAPQLDGDDPGGFREGPPPRRGGPGFGNRSSDFDGTAPFGPGGPGGPPPPGPGGPMSQKRELVKDFDKDGDGRLNKEERRAARDSMKKERSARRGSRGFGPPPGPGGRESRATPTPGPRVSPADVTSYPNAPLYEPTVLRTLFLEFEDSDWEAELTDFYHTDVDVPATLTVDGRKYPNVGVRFRGNTSFMMAGEGAKRPLNLSLDYADSKQRLYGCKTLNVLNSAEDPTFLHTVLYLEIARHYTPAPKANHVRLVINGESWGVYVNVQQFDKQFLQEWFDDARGARWKVPVSFHGGGGLSYVGEDVEAYRRLYEMKSDDGEKAWKRLITLCRTLDQTPPERLRQALKPVLDVDHVLWYLAIDNALINNDGYWVRGSDYSLFCDKQQQFHVIPHDVNETFQPPGGPGFGRGARVAGAELDPLAGADDREKPLLNRLLAVPEFKAQYLRNMRTIAKEWLDWNRLRPIVERHQSLIGKEVEADTRKLYSFSAFKGEEVAQTREAGPPGRRPKLSLKSFVEQRRTYLLNHPEIQKLAP